MYTYIYKYIYIDLLVCLIGPPESEIWRREMGVNGVSQCGLRFVDVYVYVRNYVCISEVYVWVERERE